MAKTFVSAHLEVIVDDTRLSGTSKRQGIYVGKTFSSKLAMTWFGAALTLSLGVGLTVGCGKKDLVLGLSVGFGALAVLGPVQMILAWQLRSAV